MLNSTSKFEKFKDNGLEWHSELSPVGLDIHPVETTEHLQTFDPDIQWINDFARENFTKYTISLIKQMPGKVIPYHSDSYHFFKSKHKIQDMSSIKRLNIFLEDWKPGHYFEMNNVPVVDWKAGQYTTLDCSIEHMSSNMGREPKYTAQVTGIMETP